MSSCLLEMFPLFSFTFLSNFFRKGFENVYAYKIYVCTASMEIFNQPKLKLVLLLVHSLHWKKEAQCIVGYRMSSDYSNAENLHTV